ncbi:MAG: TadE/TadG family type IV pilus assembly protein [Caulobacterales bacterium]|uniref:TadE/TadG family type IV pilus assembly protein n=1 Tax=Glycocaulis sp. TaxID=1969725 RepID=UPI003F9EE0A2
MIARFSLSRLSADTRGVSAVEFALIAPLLIALYIGSVQVTLGLSADRKLTAAASTVADLVAQTDIIENGLLADMFAAGDAVMQPYSTASLAMRVTSLSADDDGNPVFAWSQGRGMAARGAGDLPAVPAGLLLPDGGVIVVEASYVYNSPVATSGIGRFNFTETVFMRPRNVSFVPFDGEPGEGDGGSDSGSGGEGGSDSGSGGGSGSDSGSGSGGDGGSDSGSGGDGGSDSGSGSDDGGSGSDSGSGSGSGGDSGSGSGSGGSGSGSQSQCRFTGLLALLFCRSR